MIINVDKFFISEMNEAGFDICYKDIVKIYQKSRQQPACKARQIRKERERRMMDKIEDLILTAQAEEKKSGISLLEKDEDEGGLRP